MATLFFVRNGSGSDRVDTGKSVPAARINDALSRHALKFCPSIPVINPEVATSTYLAYEHVVIQVPANELSAKFPTTGYYLVLDFSPQDCVASLPESRQQA